MTQINFRIDDGLKSQADYILDRIGISMSSALNIFVRQLILHHGIPFEVRIPDESLSSPARIRQAMADYDNGGKNYHFHDLPEDADDIPDDQVNQGRPRPTRRASREKAVV